MVIFSVILWYEPKIRQIRSSVCFGPMYMPILSLLPLMGIIGSNLNLSISSFSDIRLLASTERDLDSSIVLSPQSPIAKHVTKIASSAGYRCGTKF